jgi:hypothetical protein
MHVLLSAVKEHSHIIIVIPFNKFNDDKVLMSKELLLAVKYVLIKI